MCSSKSLISQRLTSAGKQFIMVCDNNTHGATHIMNTFSGRQLVIYAGRFQPPMPHHLAVYQRLQKQFPDHQVFFAPTLKTGTADHPFDISEKTQMFLNLYGITAEHILPVNQPYNDHSYAQWFDPERDSIVLAVGGKDADRLLGKNLDPETGLTLKKSGEPAMIQPLHTQSLGVLPFGERMYVYVAPTEQHQGTTASASEFRQAFSEALNNNQAQKKFQQYMNVLDESTLKIMNQKLREQQPG